MEGEQKFQGGGGVETIEKKLEELEGRLSIIMSLETGERVSGLEGLIKEVGATLEGTDIPLENDYRDAAERIGLLLTTEKKRLELEALTRPRLELV